MLSARNKRRSSQMEAAKRAQLTKEASNQFAELQNVTAMRFSPRKVNARDAINTKSQPLMVKHVKISVLLALRRKTNSS